MSPDPAWGVYIGWRRAHRSVIEYEVENVEESAENAISAAAEIGADIVEWHGPEGSVPVRRNKKGRRLPCKNPR